MIGVSVFLLLFGLIPSTVLFCMGFVNFTSLSGDVPMLLGGFVNAFVHTFLSEGGVLYTGCLTAAAVVLLFVNLRNGNVPKFIRLSLLACFFISVLFCGAAVWSNQQQANTVMLVCLIFSGLFNTAYAVLLFINTVKSFLR